MHIHTKKRRMWPIMLLMFSAFLVGAAGYGYYFVSHLSIEQVLTSDIALKSIQELAGKELANGFELLPILLGLEEPQTYVFLFLNNTEMRPAGGFLGSYATVRVREGHVETLVVEGTESLDKRTPETWRLPAPAILTDTLGVDRWYFRDGNWSPDFGESAKTLAVMYAAEGGVAADELDGMIGFTPTVLEELLRISGPMTIDGMTFTAENAIEKLEFEVEYGYKDTKSFEQRKALIGTFFEELVAHAKKNAITNPRPYMELIESMLAQKQIMIAHNDSDVQKTIDANGWGGKFTPYESDTLSYIDANLAALKTDHAINRQLAYTVQKEQEGYVGVVTMTYEHTGAFDWRTTRYLSYPRIYVPKGATLLSVTGNLAGKEERLTNIDSGEELGRTWYGTKIKIEPGNTFTLSWKYMLPKNIQEQIAKGSYSLDLIKQAGSTNVDLSAILSFENPITDAQPAEVKEDWGNNEYTLRRAPFLEDQHITIEL